MLVKFCNIVGREAERKGRDGTTVLTSNFENGLTAKRSPHTLSVSKMYADRIAHMTYGRVQRVVCASHAC